MRKILSKMYIALTVVFILWMVVSYVEVISKNLEPNPQYSKCNFIAQVVQLGGNQ